MMDFTMLFVCLLAFMVIQALGTYVQVQQYKKAVRRLHKKGNIGIGSKRSRIRNNIVIIACDNQGKIVDGELMEGLTEPEDYRLRYQILQFADCLSWSIAFRLFISY